MADEAGEADEDESLLKSQLFILLIIFGSVALVVIIYHLVKITWIRRRYPAARQPPPLISSRDQPSGGQEYSTIEAIPAHKFRKGEATGEDGGTCAVCLCDFEDGDEVRTLPECVHSFHAACIDMWLYSHSNCPVCRTVAVPPLHTPAVRHGSSVVLELLDV